LFGRTGVEIGASYLKAMPPVHFVLVILEMGVSKTICPDCFQTSILLISATQVGRITGVIHEHLAYKLHLTVVFLRR
jgi:hypothetical protein